MPSERVQRQIDRFLDEADAAVAADNWDLVGRLSCRILTLDLENADPLALAAAAERGLANEAVGNRQSAVGEETETPSSVGEDALSSRAAEIQHSREPRGVALSDGEREPEPEPPAVRAGGSPALRDGDASSSSDIRNPLPVTRPTAFVNGRCEVVRLLGEGGKKRVYLACDKTLDREVAFALIKTEGLDEIGRQRILREGQAMGTLGSDPHIVTVFDLGELPAASSEQRATRGGAGQPYMVTELMRGGDVEGLIEKDPAKWPGSATEARQAIQSINGALGRDPSSPALLPRGEKRAQQADPTASVRAEAMRHLDFAIAEFREMKMQPALERALRHRELLHA